MKHWQEDSDLTGIRDPRELAELTDDEQAAFKRLWDDVNALLTKVSARE